MFDECETPEQPLEKKRRDNVDADMRFNNFKGCLGNQVMEMLPAALPGLG